MTDDVFDGPREPAAADRRATMANAGGDDRRSPARGDPR